MKQNKKALADSLVDYVGRDVRAIITELFGKKDYSEFKLAEALGAEVNATRNMLYKLHDLNLASFIKKKDNKKGWYIYYWTLHDDRISHFLLSEKKKQLASLREKILKEKGESFFPCKNQCGRLDFDKAFDFSFRCPECGELLVQDNNKAEESAALDVEVLKLERELRLLESDEIRETGARLLKNEGGEIKIKGEAKKEKKSIEKKIMKSGFKVLKNHPSETGGIIK